MQYQVRRLISQLHAGRVAMAIIEAHTASVAIVLAQPQWLEYTFW